MDFDIVLGSFLDQPAIVLSHALRPDAIISVSALAAIEQLLVKVRAGERIGRLRIFCLSLTQPVPSAQLARLHGFFETDGRVEVVVSSTSGEQRNRPLSSRRGVMTEGFSGGFGGGFSGEFGGSGFSGGFGGLSRTGNVSGLSALHLSTILNVPVEVREL